MSELMNAQKINQTQFVAEFVDMGPLSESAIGSNLCDLATFHHRPRLVPNSSIKQLRRPDGRQTPRFNTVRYPAV